MDKFFETASFHIVKSCNMKCKFCYATFNDMKVKQLSRDSAFRILRKLKNAGLQKVTFAGGEPMLYKHLVECIEYAKEIGLTTSIITNGSLITGGFLSRMKGNLDWIGISIDSINDSTNEKTGRINVDKKFPFYWYVDLIIGIKNMEFKLKINTVVNSYNHTEDMNEFISWTNPDRWKVFQALKVEGQNDKQFDEVKVTDDQFNKFICRHSEQKALVPENNEYMTGSYLLVDPQGRLFENSTGKHTYSRSLIDYPIEECLTDIQLNREMFEKRGGIYHW